MENQFKLAITPNYGKVIGRIVLLFLGMIVPIAVLGISLSQGFIDPKSIPFEVVLPAYLLLVVVGTFLVIRKTHFKDTVTLTDDELQIPKLRNIPYAEMAKHKLFTARGITSNIITLNNGKKIAVGSTNNYSDEANKVFQEFSMELERRFLLYQQGYESSS